MNNFKSTIKTLENDRKTLKWECVNVAYREDIADSNNEDIYCFGDLAKAMLQIDDGFCNLYIAGVDRDFEWTMNDFKTKKPRWVEICEYMVERYGKNQVQEIQIMA